MAISVGEVEGTLRLRDQFTSVLRTAQTELSSLKQTGQDAMQGLSDKTEHASVSVGGLRGSLMQAFHGDFEGAIKGVAEAIGTDLEGSLVIGTSAMVGMTAGALALAGGLAYLAVQAIEAGEANNDFSDKTAIAADSVEPLREAAVIAGGSLEQMGNLIFRTQQRMAENHDEFALGLKRIGLSFRDVEGLEGDKLIYRIATAFKENTDASNRAATATELWGRSGRDSIPMVMKPLEEIADRMRDLGHVMSDEDTKAAEELGMAWRELKEKGSWFGTEVGLGVIHFFQDFVTWANAANFVANDLLNTEKAAHDARSTLLGELPIVRDNLKDLAAKQLDVAVSAGEQKRAEDALTKNAEELIAAYIEMNSAGTGWLGTLDAIDGEVVEAIKYYLAAGVAQDKLAKAYGLTAAQVKSVATSVTEETKAMALEAELTAQTKALRDQYYKEVNAASHDTVSAQVNDAWLAADAQIAAMEKTKKITLEDYDLIWAKAQQTADNIVQKTLEADKFTKEHYKMIADQAKVSYDFALDHASSYTTAEIQMFHEAYVKATQDSNHWAATASKDMEDVANTAPKVVKAVAQIDDMVRTLAGDWMKAADAKARALQGNSMTYDLSTQGGMDYFKKMNPGAVVNANADYFKTHTLQQAIEAGLVDLYAGYKGQVGGGVPSFAEGGSGDFGSGTLAMLHGKEAIVPLGSGGAAAGIAPVINFYINGSVREMARPLTDEIIRALRQSRLLPSNAG